MNTIHRPNRAVVAAIVALSSALPSHAAPQPSLLIKWKDGPRSPAAASANVLFGARVVRNFDALGWQLVEVPPARSVPQVIDAYRALEDVVSVDQDRPRHIDVPAMPASVAPLRSLATTPTTKVPNDPRLASQWYLRKIGATNAWQTTTGSSNVVVAMLDTGVDYKHPDLAANMWVNPGETGLDANGHDKATNGIDDDGNGYIDDVHGIDAETASGDPMDRGFFGPGVTPFYHGTVCAGFVGAVGNNGLGIAGVNWSVRLMAVRWYGNLTEPYAAVMSHAMAAWDYVVAMKRRGVNVRIITTSERSNDWSPPIRDAIAIAGREGILNVCIAGNVPNDQDLDPLGFPGDFDERSILNVAASTETDRLTDFSGFGRSTVDLAAPGVNLVSLDKGAGYSVGGSGTSFAAPQVAGAAALLLARYPDLTRDELVAALLGSVDTFPALTGKLVTGGRLNVARALQQVTNLDATPIVIYASPAGWRADPQAPITATFSRPMDRRSVEAALVVNPPVIGTFEWKGDDRTFLLHHDHPFDTGTNYSIRVLGTARDATGRGLDGDFNGSSTDTPGDDYLWSFRFPVPNDDFGTPTDLEGGTGVIAGTLVHTSREPAETRFAGFEELGGTVWYRWASPQAGGWFTFDLTPGTSFDSLLSINAGDIAEQLVEVAGNDNYGSRPASRGSFLADPGRSYRLVVAGKASSLEDLVAPSKRGPFSLSWYPTPAPGFTGRAFSTDSGLPGDKLTLTGTNFTGTTAVLFNGASATFTKASGNNLDLRITAVVPPDARSGPVTVVTPHGIVTSSTTFEVLPPALLATSLPNGDIEISWTSTSPDFVLEASDDLAGATARWAAVSTAPTIEGARSRVKASPGTVFARFYRLRSRAGG